MRPPPTLLALVIPALAAAALAALSGTFETRARRPAPERADTLASLVEDPRSAIFVQRGCRECHAVAALGVKAATDVGPDLTFAYADVVNRYGVSLDAFFREPPGLMGFVLASHLHLTSQDGDSITHVLRAVYREHLADMDPDMPSSPPGVARVGARQGRERASDQAVRDRLARAQLVVLGTVTVVRRVAVRPHPPISEHDPDWRDATIKVEQQLKGSLTPGSDTVHVLFRASQDVRWFQCPKFTQGQVGIFLLHVAELPASTLPKTAGPAYTAVNSLDFQDRDQVSRITRLLSPP